MLNNTSVPATGTNFIPKLLTHGCSFVASPKALRAISSLVGLPLIDGLGIATATGGPIGCLGVDAATGWASDSTAEAEGLGAVGCGVGLSGGKRASAPF